jgi:hypothetical protein
VRVGWIRLLWRCEIGVLEVDVLSLFTAGQAGVEDLNWRFPLIDSLSWTTSSTSPEELTVVSPASAALRHGRHQLRLAT